MSTLDREHQAHFAAHGYVLLAGHSGAQQAARLARWSDQLASWEEAPGRWMKWYEGARPTRQLFRVENFLPYHRELREYLQGGALGSALVFDSYVPHRSGPNRSDRPRRALYVTYNHACEGSLRSAYLQRKRSQFPPECERVPGVDYSRAAATYNLGNPIS